MSKQLPSNQNPQLPPAQNPEMSPNRNLHIPQMPPIQQFHGYSMGSNQPPVMYGGRPSLPSPPHFIINFNATPLEEFIDKIYNGKIAIEYRFQILNERYSGILHISCLDHVTHPTTGAMQFDLETKYAIISSKEEEKSFSLRTVEALLNILFSKPDKTLRGYSPELEVELFNIVKSCISYNRP